MYSRYSRFSPFPRSRALGRTSVAETAAWHRGVADSTEGKPIFSGPYSFGSSQARAWLLGYADGAAGRHLTTINTHPLPPTTMSNQPFSDKQNFPRLADASALNLPPRPATARPDPVARPPRKFDFLPTPVQLCIGTPLVAALLAATVLLWHAGGKAERDVTALRAEAHRRPVTPQVEAARPSIATMGAAAEPVLTSHAGVDYKLNADGMFEPSLL